MSPREFVCQWADCRETDTPVIVTDKQRLERNYFCCGEHAAQYLLRRCSLAALGRIMETHK